MGRGREEEDKNLTWVRIWSLSSPRVAFSPVSGSTAESISASAFLPLLFFAPLLLVPSAASGEEEEELEEEEAEAFTAFSISPSILSRTLCLAFRARPKAENLPRS